MTIKTDRDAPYWEPVDVHTRVGYWHDDDHWPHFATQAKCAEAIAEIHRDRNQDYDEPLHLVAAHCFPSPCVVIVCDGCGEHFDYDDHGGSHFDPSDPMPVPITDCEWSIEERPGRPDRHFHDDCRPAWCDDCDERHEAGDCPEPPAIPTRPVPVHRDQGVLL